MSTIEKSPSQIPDDELVEFTREYLLNPCGPGELDARITERFPGQDPLKIKRKIGTGLYKMAGVEPPSNYARSGENKRIDQALADALGVSVDQLLSRSKIDPTA